MATAIAPRIKYSNDPVEDGRGAGCVLDWEPEGDPDPEPAPLDPGLVPPLFIEPELGPELPPEFSPPDEGLAEVIDWSRLRLVLARISEALISNPHDSTGEVTIFGVVHGLPGVLGEVEMPHCCGSISSNPV